MTKVTCASCGVDCEVPFNPTSNKPVYCSDCFRKQNKDSPDRSSRSSNKSDFSKDFSVLNEKLDKIISFLGMN